MYFKHPETKLRVVSSIHSIDGFWAFVIHLVLKLRQNAETAFPRPLKWGMWNTCCQLLFLSPWPYFQLCTSRRKWKLEFLQTVPHLITSLFSHQFAPSHLPRKENLFFSVWRTPCFTLFWLLFVLCFDVISPFHLKPPFGSLLSFYACSQSPSPPPCSEKSCFLSRLLIIVIPKVSGSDLQPFFSVYPTDRFILLKFFRVLSVPRLGPVISLCSQVFLSSDCCIFMADCDADGSVWWLSG